MYVCVCVCVCVKLTPCVFVCKVDPYLVVYLVISDLLNEALTVPISLLYGVIYNRTLDYIIATTVPHHILCM